MVIPNAVIFDMDGLMFDSERIARAGWIHAGEVFGLPITEDLFHQIVGSSRVTIRETFIRVLGDFDFDQVRAERAAFGRAYMEKYGVPIKPGLFALLDFLDDAGIKKAVASSTYQADAMFYLTKAGIAGRFDGIVTGDMVTNGKPAPDIFLLAASILGMHPADCIVLEDSSAGILAATTAGMRVIGIPDLVPLREECEALVCAKLDSLLDVIPFLQSM